MQAIAKGAAAGITAAALWLTANLGEAWWALLILLAIDAVLNWRDERRLWQKVLATTLTTAAAVYLQGATGIAMVHLIVAGLAAFELTRVGEQLYQLVSSAHASGRISAAEAQAADSAIAALQARVQHLEAATAKATGPTPGSVRDQAGKTDDTGGKAA